MRTRGLGAALLAAIACMVTGPASAAPPMPPSSAPPRTVASLATIVASSPTIVVGRFSDAAGTSIQVDAVLRGAGVGPVLKVAPPPGHWPVINPSEPVVLFIDGNGVPRWVGKATMPLRPAPSLEGAVIHLQGICNPAVSLDLVSPGILTLAQLKQFLATGGFDQTFDVTLQLRANADPWSSLHFAVHAQGVASAKPTVSVTGLTLACLGASEVQIPDPPGSLVLRFRDNCRASTRSLELVGWFTGVDTTTGHLLANVEPWRPVLTAREFDWFARDKFIVDVQRVVNVSAVLMPWETTGWKSWRWRLEDQTLEDPSGKIHRHAEPPIVLGPGASTATLDFGDAAIVIGRPFDGRGSILDGDRWSVYRLLMGGGESCTFSRRGQPDVPCKLEPQDPIFVRRGFDGQTHP